ncbi:MAG TPA: alpha/beta fold hydrolase [Trebonia sp.]
MTDSVLPRRGRKSTAGIAVVAVAVLAGAALTERSRIAVSLAVLGHMRWSWLPAAIVLEALSMAAFAWMFRRLLTAGSVRQGRGSVLATVYAANAVSVTVPLAGPELGTAILFRRFTRHGADGLLAGWVLLAGGVITTAAWLLILAGGGLASGHTLATLITIPCALLAVAAIATAAAATRRPRLRAALERRGAWGLQHATRLVRRPAEDPAGTVRAWTERMGSLRLPASGWALASGAALANWLTDIGVLAVSVLAVGAAIPWRDLLLVYAAGITAKSLAVTPGGLAITEGALSVSLVASGMRASQALAAAVLYRLVSFWLVAVAGWLTLLLLRVRRSAPLKALPATPAADATAMPDAHELVLLHGQPGSPDDWQAVIARLPEQLRASAPDRPGYGASPRPAGGFTVNAQAVLDDLDARGVRSAVLVGHSWGGGVALRAASMAPDRVQAVVLLAGVGPGCDTSLDWLLAAPGVGELSSLLAFRWTPWIARVRLAWLRRRQGRPLYPGESASLQVWGQAASSPQWPLWRTFLIEQRALLRELKELEAAAESIRVPVLLIADPADRVVPVKTSHRLAEMLPDARLMLVSGTGHHLPRRAPRAVADAIAEFLAELDDARPATDADGRQVPQAS